MSSLLALLQLVSPALPVGAFSYSEGLEVLVQQGRLAAADEVQAWLEAELQRGLVRVEAAALNSLTEELEHWRDEPCGPAEQRVRELDDWLLAQREALEMRQQQRQMGRSLMQLLTGLGWTLPDGAVDLSWPAAWSWAGLCLDLGGESLCKGYLFSWVANQLSAAVRLVPLGPTESQRLQLALAPMIDFQARQLQDQDPRQLTTAGVGAGLAQLQHAELYSRLFRS